MSDTGDRCPRCDGTGIEPGSGDYDHAVHMVNPMTQEPCSVCHGTGAGYECDCDLHTGDLARLRSSLAMAHQDVRAAYAEREEMWERKAAALRERDDARRELDDLHEQRAQLKMKLAKSEDVRREQQAKLYEIAMAKVWTNEDGKRFVFADDLAAILRPDLTTPTPTTRTETA